MKDKIKQYYNSLKENDKVFKDFVRFFGELYPCLFQKNFRDLLVRIDKELNLVLSNCLISRSKRIMIPFKLPSKKDKNNSYYGYQEDVFLTEHPGLKYAYSRGSDISWISNNVKIVGGDILVQSSYDNTPRTLGLSILKTTPGIDQNRLTKFYSFVQSLEETMTEQKLKGASFSFTTTIEKTCQLEANDIGVHVVLKDRDNDGWISWDPASFLSSLNHARSYGRNSWKANEKKEFDIRKNSGINLFLDHYEEVVHNLSQLEARKKKALNAFKPLLKQLENETQPLKLFKKLQSK